jgi:hypothetical protein
MKNFLSFVLLTACLSVGSPLFAQGKGGGGAPATHPQTGPVDHGDKSPKSDAKTTTATAGPTNPVSQKLSEHPALSAKLESMLPKGTSLDMAASGFKNLGQFVAAVHVSSNLNIPFDQLKAKMVTDHMSLGSAIHALKPNVTSVAANTEAKKAEDQAKDDTKNKS